MIFNLKRARDKNYSRAIRLEVNSGLTQLNITCFNIHIFQIYNGSSKLYYMLNVHSFI